MVTECVSFVSSGPSSFPSNIPSSDPDATPSNNTGTFPSSDPSSSFPQPSSPATPAATSTGLSTTVIIAIAVPAAIVLLVVVIVAAVCIRRRNKAKQNPVSTGGFSHAGAPIGAGANGAPGTWQNQPGFSSPQTLYAGAVSPFFYRCLTDRFFF
ncbi:hypothetical protein BC829DRAFT_146966 [Chytridium lagenaria]|nr:hypothetical protein BC829DRAFT_146966 [Chytridium lagenaria]